MKLEWKTCLKVGVSIFLLYLCISYWKVAANLLGGLVSAASPLIIGCAIAYLINILMSLYERHYFPKSQKTLVIKSRRPVCMAGAIITLLAVVALVIGLVVPQLVSCVTLLVNLLVSEVPGWMSSVLRWLDGLGFVPQDIINSLASIDWQSKIGQILSILTSGIGSVMDVVISTISSVFSGLVTGLLSVIFSLYLLMSKETLCGQANRLLKRYLKEHWYARVRYAYDILHDCFRRYIVGQCLEAVILGLLCTLGMWIFRLPYATMIGALMAFTALIPVAGAYIGAFVGAFMILTVSPIKALFFLIFIVVLQQLEGNLIYPRVVGSSMGLPGIWVLAAVTIGGGVMGILGMLLGVPLAAAIYRFVRNDMHGIGPETGQEASQQPEAT